MHMSTAMQSICSAKHTSYAALRLQIFRELFRETKSQPIGLVPLISPSSHNLCRTTRRCIHHSTRLSNHDFQDGASHHPENVPDAERSNLQEDHIGDKLQNVSSKRPRPKKWKPTSPEGQQDLKDLTTALKSTFLIGDPKKCTRDEHSDDTSESKATLNSPFEQSSFGSTPDGDFTTKHPSDLLKSLPESPLMRGHSKRRPPKKKATGPRDLFRRNVWAKMLASPIRHCSVSRIRAPESFLIDFAFVDDPLGNNTVTLLPHKLGDLEALKEHLIPYWERPLKQKAGNEAALKASPCARMLASQLLVDTVTDQVIALNPQTKTLESRGSMLTGSFLPVRWDDANESAKAYQRASKEYLDTIEATGQILYPPVPAKLPNFEKLKWKSDIVQRMDWIMRQRILLVLNAVGRGQERETRKSTMQGQVICLKAPSSGFLDSTSFRGNSENRATPPATGMATQNDRNSVYWNDMGDIEAEDAVSGGSHKQGGRDPVRPPIALQAADLDAYSKVKNRPEMETCSPASNLPGSVLLYVGSASKYQDFVNLLQHKPSQRKVTDGETNVDIFGLDNAFIPPMIIVNGRQRIPVFSLQSLLEQRLEPMLSQILSRYSSFQPSLGSGINSSDSEEYLILIPPYAFAGKELAHEIWQLWRYIGGLKGLPESMSMGLEKSKIPMTLKEESRELSPSTINASLEMLGELLNLDATIDKKTS